MTTNITLPEMRSSAFALKSTINGLVSALLLLLAGQMANRFDLRRMMFWFMTIPYAINAVYWFIFYKHYPRDVENVQRILKERAANLGAEKADFRRGMWKRRHKSETHPENGVICYILY